MLKHFLFALVAFVGMGAAAFAQADPVVLTDYVQTTAIVTAFASAWGTQLRQLMIMGFGFIVAFLLIRRIRRFTG
jgi:hypothetical protein